jgi:hypothetical protein
MQRIMQRNPIQKGIEAGIVASPIVTDSQVETNLDIPAISERSAHPTAAAKVGSVCLTLISANQH